jgi:plastocyanin
MFRIVLLGLALAAEADAPPLAAQTAATKSYQIDIQGFAFVPASVEIHPGDIVEWTNRDLAPHTATDDASHWDTGSLKSAAKGRFVAAAAGTFAYHCAFHPHMKGTIVVVAP